MKFILYLSFISLLLGVAGCKPEFSFGEDVELSGSAFNAAKLDQISKLTGIIFPSGSMGKDYFYQGSGIDDALAAKIIIPDEGVNEFMKNAIFLSGSDSRASIEIGKSKAWWKLESLTKPPRFLT